MVKTHAFETHAASYDAWFEDHVSLYESELQAVKTLLPDSDMGIEIGTGTGRFSQPLGIRIGIEPSAAMRAIAGKRGITMIAGVAEKLPLSSATFEYALYVTTLCFLDSLSLALDEAFRILRPQGAIVIGFIDKQSALGKTYQQRSTQSPYYRDATFYSVDEITSALDRAGFTDFSYVQTLCNSGQTTSVEPTRQGYGDGAFIVVRATRPADTS